MTQQKTVYVLARTGPSRQDSTNSTTTAPVASKNALGPRSLDTLLRHPESYLVLPCWMTRAQR